MIERYSDHAANERTFLAWVRSGIAIVAFGFVVQKFNLFVRTLAEANSAEAAKQMHLDRLARGFSHYDGMVLIVFGMAIILISLVRFMRTTRLIEDQQSHSAGSVRAELMLSVVLTLIVASLMAYFAVE